MGGVAIGQSDMLAHLLCHHDFLSCSVNEFELALWKQDGQWNPRKATTCTEIKHACGWCETHQFPDGHGVEHMVFIEVVDVLARDDVDFGVPLTVERTECFQLFLLSRCEFREIFADTVYHDVL